MFGNKSKKTVEDRRFEEAEIRRRDMRQNEPITFNELSKTVIDDLADLNARYAEAERLLALRDDAKRAEMEAAEADRIASQNEAWFARLKEIEQVENPAADAAKEAAYAEVRAAEARLLTLRGIYSDKFNACIILSTERAKLYDRLHASGAIPPDPAFVEAQRKRAEWELVQKYGRKALP